VEVYYQLTVCKPFSRAGFPYVWIGVSGVADPSELKFLKTADLSGAGWTHAVSGPFLPSDANQNEQIHAVVAFRAEKGDDVVELRFSTEPTRPLVDALAASLEPGRTGFVAFFSDASDVQKASQMLWRGEHEPAHRFCLSSADYFDTFTIEPESVAALKEA
jgi:hypothetical protein